MNTKQFLAPHEYHPDFVPQIVRADEHQNVYWNGRERKATIVILEWPFAGRTIHVRFEGDETSFALSTVPPGNVSTSSFAPSKNNLKRRLYNAIRDARLWRRFFFESGHSDLSCTAFVRNGGVCQWVAADAALARQQQHPVKQPQRFLIEGADIVEDAPDILRAKIAAELKIRHSDASFALAVATRKVTMRKTDEPTPWKKALRDSQAPMQGLWRLVCRAYGPSETLKGGSLLRCCGFAMDDWKNARVETFPESPTLQLWGKALLHFAPASPRQMLPLQHLCIRDAIGSVNLNIGCWAREFWSLTFHEQLEARLELRDWARANLPDDVAHELELRS